MDLFGGFQTEKNILKNSGFSRLCEHIFHIEYSFFFWMLQILLSQILSLSSSRGCFLVLLITSSTEDHVYPPQGKPSSKKSCLFFHLHLFFSVIFDFLPWQITIYLEYSFYLSKYFMQTNPRKLFMSHHLEFTC